MKITEESMRQQEIPAESAHPAAEPVLSEREKLKSMNFKDKCWYIWTYYKFHILGCIVAILFLVGVGNAMYRSTFHTSLYCMFINQRSEEGVNMLPLEQDFAAHMNLGKKQPIVTESCFISLDESATDFSYASMAKISALLAAKDLDIIIADEAIINHYASLGGFLDLETGLSPDVLSLVKDHLYKTTGDDGALCSYAIDISKTPFAEASNITTSPALFSIISNSTRTENVEALLRYIFAP